MGRKVYVERAFVGAMIAGCEKVVGECYEVECGIGSLLDCGGVGFVRLKLFEKF